MEARHRVPKPHGLCLSYSADSGGGGEEEGSPGTQQIGSSQV